MPEERCEFTEMLKDGCAHCLGVVCDFEPTKREELYG